ncbi:MAG: hypothetical protein METHP_02071 [Methanoregula sp. SKADARSKE-2]|nr:MAG: hypothetical protein METHP_02071 [Methanoregula sp. SKADARSKE-2]
MVGTPWTAVQCSFSIVWRTASASNVGAGRTIVVPWVKEKRPGHPVYFTEKLAVGEPDILVNGYDRLVIRVFCHDPVDHLPDCHSQQGNF